MNFAILDAILKYIFLLNFQVLLSNTVSIENPELVEYLILLPYGKEGKKPYIFREQT